MKRIIFLLTIFLVLSITFIACTNDGDNKTTESKETQSEPIVTEPETDAPEPDAPETDAPETDAPETDAPETDAPETDAPETDAPETDAPETDAPETDAPETDAPETDTPETDAPETDAPETDAPETEPEPEPEPSSLLVGYAREFITPPDDMLSSLTLIGYADKRKITTVESDLYVTCTAFRDEEGDTALIFSLDLHSMSNVNATALIMQILKETDVPRSNIILNVTHNHAAPGASGDYYSKVITPAAVKAAVDAIADLKACTKMYGGEIYMRGSAFIRRYIKDENGKNVAHVSEMDNMVPVARFVRDGGKDVILVNFAAHCDTVTARSKTTLSADYVGFFRESMEEQLDCHFAMQLGATGDVNPQSLLQEFSLYKGMTNIYGKRLADLVVSEIKDLPRLAISTNVEAISSNVKVNVNHTADHLLDKANEVIELYYAGDTVGAEAKMKEYGFATIYEAQAIGWRAKRDATERRPISAISVGNIVFAAADYEMFAKTGRNIKNAGNEHYDLTFMCAYSNGMESGYIPTREIFEYDFYEVYSCIFEPGTAELIEAGIIGLIDELAGATPETDPEDRPPVIKPETDGYSIFRLEAYGQQHWTIEEKCTEAPLPNGVVESGEYTLEILGINPRNDASDDRFFCIDPGALDIENVNLYLSYDRNYLYLAVEITENDTLSGEGITVYLLNNANNINDAITISYKYGGMPNTSEAEMFFCEKNGNVVTYELALRRTILSDDIGADYVDAIKEFCMLISITDDRDLVNAPSSWPEIWLGCRIPKGHVSIASSEEAAVSEGKIWGRGPDRNRFPHVIILGDNTDPLA